MRSIAIWTALALVCGGCHCGQKFNSLAPKLVIAQPTARDGGEWVLDLGAVPVPGSQSGQIVIQNDGQIAANLLTAKLRSGSDPAFSFTPPALPDSIVGGASLSMTVKYAPVSAGSAVGWVDLATDDPGLLSATVLLLANGESSELQVCVEMPADGGWQCNGGQQTMSVDFGALQLGSTESRNVQVRNIGNGPMQYLGTSLSAATSPEYALSPAQNEPDGGVALDAGLLRQFALVFSPTSFGAATGMATVSTTDPTTPWVNIDVVGHGLASANCALQVSPTQVAFGSVPNTAPADQALVVVNTGAQPCHITGLPLSGSAAFTVPGAPSLPVTLPSNGVLTLDVHYAPSGTAVDNGTLTVQSDDPVNPSIAVPLSATSIAPPPCFLTAQPPTLAFGGLLPGQRKLLGVALTATGTDTCAVFSAKIRHGDPAFSVTTTMPLAITVAKPGGINVNYAPLTAGFDGDELDLTYLAGLTGPTLTLTVPLSGAAGPAQLCVLPTQLHYGAVPVGQNKTLSFTLTACGTAPVNVSSIAVEPVGTPFALSPSPTLPLSLAVGTNAGQGVQLTPTTTNPVSAKVHVVSDDPVFPDQYVQLDTSPETPCVLKISPTSVSFGVVPPFKASSQQVLLTNLGSGNCNLTNIALSNATPPSFSLIGAPASLTLASGQTAPPLVVQANLPSGTPSQRQGKVTFASNDLSQPNVTIPISAYLKDGGPYSQGWPKLYLDNNNTSRTPSDTSSVTGRVLWTFQLQAAPAVSALGCPTYAISPVVAPNGTVYQLDLFGAIHAIAPDGSLLWTVSGLSTAATDPFGATPFIAADGSLYFTGGSDSANASPAMMYHLAPSGVMLAQSSPAAGGGRGPADGFDVAPLLSSSGDIFAFDDFPMILIMQAQSLQVLNVVALPPPNGNERANLALAADDTSYWHFSGAMRRYSSPATGMQLAWQYPAGGGQLFNGVSYGAQVAINPVTGNVLMSAGWGGTTIATGLAAVDATTGAEIWQKLLPEGPGTPQTNPLNNGCTLFTTDTGNSAPSIGSDGTVYVGNVDGMYALDANTGSVLPGWPYKTAPVTDTASIGGDGALFFGTVDGTFYGLNPDGSLRFTLSAGARISSSPAIGPDGTVFFIADTGLLYAVH